MPAPGGRDFLQAYNCQAVVDSAHQVIVAAQATNQTSDKQQAVAMVEEAIDNVGAVPKEVSADAGYYSAQAVEGLSGCAWTRSSHRSGPATAQLCRRRLGVAYPAICLPGIGCAFEAADQTGCGSATLYGCKRWNLRSSRAEASASSCCGAWRRSAGVVADLHRSQPAQAVPLWGGSASRNTDQQVCSKCPEHRRGGWHSEAYETIGPSVAAPGDLSPSDTTARQSILRRAASTATQRGVTDG